MKNLTPTLVLATALSGLATGLYASELDLQPGQWSISLQPTDFYFDSDGYEYENPSTESVETERESTIKAALSAEYRVNEKISAGGYVSYYSVKGVSQVEESGTLTTDDTYKDSVTRFNPYVKFYVTPDISIIGKLAYYSDDAAESTDINGDTSYSTYNYKNRGIYIGAGYIKELNDKLVLDGELLIGSYTYGTEDPEDESINDEYSYTEVDFSANAKYFFNPSFSADAGLSLVSGSFSKYRYDGEEIDVSEIFDDSYLDYGIDLGFSYYHR